MTDTDQTAIEQTVARIREMNERMIASSKSAGITYLDAYEKALNGMLDFQQKVAGASQLDWLTTLANTQARFVQDVSGAYVKAVRESLAG